MRPLGFLISTIVGTSVSTETVKGHAAQKTRWDDAVGVNIVATNGNAAAGYFSDNGHNTVSFYLNNYTAAVKVERTSDTLPLRAAMATIDGLINKVRPCGDP